MLILTKLTMVAKYGLRRKVIVLGNFGLISGRSGKSMMKKNRNIYMTVENITILFQPLVRGICGIQEK